MVRKNEIKKRKLLSLNKIIVKYPKKFSVNTKSAEQYSIGHNFNPINEKFILSSVTENPKNCVTVQSRYKKRCKKMKNEIVGYTSGVYDLFHIGHLNIIRNAKSMCDRLIVGVTTDDLMFETKKKKCVFKFEERIEIVRNIKHVDCAIPQETMDKYDAWKKLKFDRMFVGDDWYNSPKWERIESDLKKVGVDIIYFPYTKGTSSTLINDILEEKRNQIK